MAFFDNINNMINEVANLFKGKQQFNQPSPMDMDPITNKIPTSSGYQAPIKGSYYSSGQFSPNKATDARHSQGHKGVDLRAAGGTSAYPITDGIVSNITSGGKGGLTISINHPNNVRTYYAHMGTVKVQKGDKVDKNTVIGTVGDSGNAKGTAPHIHFQVWENNQLQDPGKYFHVPIYKPMGKEEKMWESDEAKQQAETFDLKQHDQKRKQAFSNSVNKLEKLASAYLIMSKKIS